MKVNDTHLGTAKNLFSDGKNTPQVQTALKAAGLTHAQANTCCRDARKKLGIYKSLKKMNYAAAAKAKAEANDQSEKKTKVNED